MSTPSTATITVPPNHQYYPHPPPPQYLPAMADYHHNASAQYPSGPSTTSSNKAYSNSYGGSSSSSSNNNNNNNNTTNGSVTAAADHAQHNHHYHHQNQQQQQQQQQQQHPLHHRRPVGANAGSGAGAGTGTSTPRPAPSQSHSQSHLTSHAVAAAASAYNYDASAAPTAPSSSSGSARKRGREEPVNWEQYFGGKPPKEIIVIDDDEPSHAPSATSTTLQPNAGPSHTSYPPSAANASSYHTDKRRKMATSTTTTTTNTGPTTNYDPVYNPHQQSYSNTQTPYYEPAPRTYTGSTDRTASYNNNSSSNNNNNNNNNNSSTTAPTSLSSNGTYLDDAAVGQKRKRTTRQAAADQKKREVATRPDPYSEYVPPPKPPLKAKEVFVPQVSDRITSRDQKVDDDDGHYIVVENSELTERYSVGRLLGQGTFGKVVQAWDHKRSADVAIKIIRSVQKYRDASRIELRVLSTLAQNDKPNRNKCIHLRDTFDYKNHICIVTDLLGQSVFDFLKSNQFVPFPSSHIQKFARQLFTSVAFLHDLNLIHTDLKPENILLVNNNYQTFTYNRNIPSSSTTTARSAKFRRVLLDPEIRLIDFGSATFDDEYHSSVVSTRHYRAPEIILNLGWSFPCDIWSIGCILVEFFTGDALFQTHDNLEHLAMMEAICDGALDKPLIRQVTSGRGSNKNAAAAYFKRQNLDYPQPDTPRSSRKFVKAMKHLHWSIIRPRKPELQKNPYIRYLRPLQETIPPHTEFNRKFLDLLKKIFVYDPKKRITAHQALQHEWFREHFEDDGTEAEKIRFERERTERSKKVHTPR